MNAAEFEQLFDALIDAAFEVLLDRVPGSGPVSRERLRAVLHDSYDVRAYELLVADVEHSGEVTITAAGLAALLVPPEPEPSPVAAGYELAAARRQERRRDEPSEWLPKADRERCIANARAAIAQAKADAAAAALAAKDAATAAQGTPNGADRGTV